MDFTSSRPAALLRHSVSKTYSERLMTPANYFTSLLRRHRHGDGLAAELFQQLLGLVVDRLTVVVGVRRLRTAPDLRLRAGQVQLVRRDRLQYREDDVRRGEALRLVAALLR